MVSEKARELGIALSESEEFRHMLETRAAMESDTALIASVNEFSDMQKELNRLMVTDGADLTRIETISSELERLRDELLEAPLFDEMLNAQTEFESLMKKVNSIIAACIGLDEGGEETSECSVTCSGCSGCKH